MEQLPLIVSFDSFMETVTAALARHQAIEQENGDLKTELEVNTKTIQSLRQNLEEKIGYLEVIQNDRLRRSKDLTQICYDNGKLIQATEQASKLKYEVRGQALC